MNRPVLKLRQPITTWVVEEEYIVGLPPSFEALTLEVLRQELQQSTLRYRTRPDRPPIGPLSFRYETDNRDRVTVVHAYFTGKDGRRKRYARLRRV